LIWKNVEGSKVKALFSDIKTHPDSWKANSQLLAEYIQKKIQENELTSWTVALISKSGIGQILIGGQKIEPTTRDLSTEPGKLSIGRLVNPIDETLDFDEAKRREALARTVSYWKANPGRVQNEPDRPAGPVIREMRSPQNGLLLIYPIKDDDKTPLMGFAVSFPKSGTQTDIEYKVNNVYWDQEFGPQ
jgi:hypothetical protein